MRSLVLLAMLTATLTHAAWKGYTEDRNLELPADGIDVLEIDAGAGSLEVTGTETARDIRVLATIKVADSDEDAKKMIATDLRLSLERKHDTAILESFFDHSRWRGNGNAAIDLQVEIPRGLDLVIDDGSGSMHVEAAGGKVHIDDGSGSISVVQAGEVIVDDGSGSIKIIEAAGDVSIDDGSGDIYVSSVQGSVTIDDGSGSINVDDVAQDLTIVDDGSGSLRLSAIRGRITRPDE